MYLDTAKSVQNGKIYFRYLLRENYRENGKVKHRTIANLSRCSDGEIRAIKIALKHKHNLDCLINVVDDIEIEQGCSIGAVWVLYQVAKRLGIKRALGNDRSGKLAMWQVIARIIGGSSRLAAVRLAQTHAACDVLDIREPFNEDSLYKNLDWLCENQERIEKKFFRFRHGRSAPNLFLYDVTSSYLEGMKNDLGDWGYNRDKKMGKMQIVIGLLCDDKGAPVSIEVFRGNTNDHKTFLSQVKKLAGRFGCRHVTLTGDRGMIKSAQISALSDENFGYITAITKSQIEGMLRSGALQMGLFDEELSEVIIEEKGGAVRYILRRNSFRAREIADCRENKMVSVERLLDAQKHYLEGHPGAKVDVAMRKIREKIAKLKMEKWVDVAAEGRALRLAIDDAALGERAKLDGCYVIKSDIAKDAATAREIHDRYKDLAFVEQAFRTCKSDLLKMRPVFVRRERHTRGHALVVMFGYALVRYLRGKWAEFDLTVAEGIGELDRICSIEMTIKSAHKIHKIPKAGELGRSLLRATEVILPEVLPKRQTSVATRHPLKKRRTNH